MPEVRSFTYPSADGIHTIHAREWRPDTPPRALVQIVHGVAEHMGRYDQTAQILAGQGYLVCGGDHLGHGRTASPGEFGFFAPEHGWELVLQDVYQLHQLQTAAHPELPCFLLGHSMGSFLVRTYLCRYPGTVSGAILSGTGQESALRVAGGKWIARTLARRKGDHYISPLIHRMSLGAYNRKFRPNRTPADWLTRDSEQVDGYLRDPLCRFQPTVGMFADLMEGLQYIARPGNLARMDRDTPVFLFSGDQDPVGGMGRGVKKVYSYFYAQGVRDLTLKFYPGGRHEMFHEINRDEVHRNLLVWLDRHTEKSP